MSQLVKTKRQANFKDFKPFGAFKGFVEQKNIVFGTRGPLKCSFHSRFKHAKNLHTNLLNKLTCDQLKKNRVTWIVLF
jgi:hypothetical protein